MDVTGHSDDSPGTRLPGTVDGHAGATDPEAATPESLEVLARLRPLVEVMEALHTLHVAHGLIARDPVRAATRVAEAIAALDTAVVRLRSGLPRLPDVHGPTEHAAPPPDRVLMCARDAGVRRLLTVLFDVDPRFDVVTAVPDAETGLEQVMRERPDLVLLDLAMADIDGLGAIRRIREQAPECRVIVLAGGDQPQAVEQALRVGAAAVLFKGDTFDGLLDEVSAVMQRCRRAPSAGTASVVDLPGWVASRAAWRS